ncbi:uncharacterized protein LOC111375173, partial [Olea europaea var. sylvestris]|uniref:uncharacterized protein LOC111375173 n=1 Tax=Olea europaea var. sylvestris TaxID=158386 RepID=UPI000C1D03A9
AGVSRPKKANSSATTISANVNSILMLNGTNFKDWKENILIALGCMDLDLALWIEEPTPLTKESSPDEKENFEKWDCSNRISLMIIKCGISKAFRGEYKGRGSIREYIMEMSHNASKLKGLKFELSDDLLVHLVLISLLVQFSQFKVSHNWQTEKWSLNELISYCVQEEERLKQERTESAHLARTSKDKGKKKKKEYEAAPKGPT